MPPPFRRSDVSDATDVPDEDSGDEDVPSPRPGSREPLETSKQDAIESTLEMLENTDGVDFDFDDDMKTFQQDDLVKEALAKGVDLRQYAKEVEGDLREVEKASIQDYIKESNNLASLHSQIRNCDQVLERMERMLSGFQSDLGKISSDIKHLQDESMSMNVKVRNRKAAEKKLSKFIEQVVIPPDLITNICDAEVNDSYLEFLLALNKKIDSVQSENVKETKPASDIEPQIEKLRLKAVAKVREFLLQRIHNLKRPKTNIQIIQQNVLLKFKYFNQFLAEHGTEAHAEVRETYVDILSKIYYQYFKGYITSLAKLQYDVATKSDLIGVDEKEVRTLFGTKPDPKSRYSVFSLGDRFSVLQEGDNPSPIIPHMAAQGGQKFTYEFVFRSVMHLLMDTCTSEYLFCVEFFGRSKDLFKAIFERTISLVMESVENFVQHSFDAVGILLMIRITQLHHLQMNKRRVPVLDPIFDKYNLMFWPRFKVIFDLNIESVRNAQVKKLSSNDVHPHYVTRRYGEFAAAMFALNKDHNDEMLTNGLGLLRLEMAKLVAKIASEHSTHVNKIVFLINNYDLVTSVFAERQLDSDDAKYFSEQLQQQTALFVEEELSACYGRMIQFVRRTEPLINSPNFNPDAPPVDAHAVEVLVKEFATKWKGGIEQINSNVMKFFSNFKLGMEILKQALTQLLLYYTRFLDIIKKCFRNPSFGKDIVTINSIIYEIRQYSKTFGP